jgi:cell division GTPase FtsZ
VIGFGRSGLPVIRFPWERAKDFHKKSTETHKGIEAIDEAISELSVSCRLSDAGSALYLLSAPTQEMNMDIVKEIGDYLKGLANEATIRSGDYPRQKGEVNVTLILSQLRDLDRVKESYNKLTESVPSIKRRHEEAEQKLREIEEAARDIPSLI